MKIAIIGANGQLGNDLVKSLDGEIIPLTHQEIEVSDEHSVLNMFKKYKPDVLINTSAFHNVPECEKNDIVAFKVNGLGPKFLAERCASFGTTLVHISTDYVFDGKSNSPYGEDDLPNPLNVYGITKIAGEYYVRSLMSNYFIIRTCGLYGVTTCRAKGGNFIDAMLRLAEAGKELSVVNDEFVSPTYTLDLAQQINSLIKTRAYGVFHITNEGFCSWFEFAREIFDFLGMKVKVKDIKQSEFPSNVKRPRYSVLENSRLKSLGIYSMRHWKEALRHCLVERKKTVKV